MGYLTNKLRPLIFLLSLSLPSLSYGLEGQSVIEGGEPFLLIKDPNRQAEAWATCHAAYEILATILESKSPAQSAQFHQFANGAKLAVLMSFVGDAIEDVDEDDETTIARFNASFAYGKVAMESLPETKATSLMAMLETGGARGQEQWMADIGATVEHCVENLDGQQIQIDVWRSLATSGLLKLE